jgi:hypothetical protein
MKKIIILSCLSFATAFGSIAQDNNPRVRERANHLSNQMIRDLRLNNYQASRIRAINQEAVNEMMAFERQYAGNPELIDKTCKGVCKERDKEVESFLSADQYGQYFASRSKYYKADRDFASQIGLTNAVASREKSAKQPANLPVSEKESPAESRPDPVIKPAETKVADTKPEDTK